jgi:hypothetical protein
MTELRDIKNNSGVVVGGDVSRSTISVGRTGPAGGPGQDEAQVLHRLDTLLNDLLASVGQLPPDQAGHVAGETVRLKSELVKPGRDRDPGRMRALLSSLTRAVATVAPLAGMVTDITDLIAKLPR